MTDSTAPIPTTSPRILIVDDHPNAASILARGLGQFNRPVEILTARSGEEALELIQQNPVDMLITDFMMPGMNGLELIEKLKGNQEPKHTVLITAYDSPGLAATARRLKVNDYLVKPFQPDKIRSIVGKALEGLNLPKPPSPPSASPAPVQFRILIADDRPDNVHLLATRLSSEGYTFITASDGEETLRKVRGELPDLVLLDVDMPKKNGFEVLAEMRGDPEIAHVPVIILTAARATLRDVVEGLGLGADDYVTKPFDWRELAARMRAKLRVKQAEDALRRRNRELGLLPDIGQDLSARLDMEELADVTLRRSVETLKAVNGHLVVFQPDGNALHKHQTPPDFSPWTEAEAQQHLITEGVVPQVVTSRQGLIIEDTQVDPNWLKAPNDLTQSAIAVPLSSRRGVIGVLTLTHEQPSFFKSDQLTLLQAIAGQAAIAIENAQLYTIEHKRVNELVALNQLTREISLFTHSKELFARIPELIQETLGYPTVSLWLTEEGVLTLRSLAGSENAPRHSILALAPQEVAARGQPIRISGVVEERVGTRAGVGTPPTQSSVAVPLFWEAEVSGVLAIHSLRPYAFQESDRVLLETVAAQVATALDRIRLFESVEQEEQRLAAVLRGAADAILVLDTEGRLRLLNPAGYRLFTTDHVEIKLGQSLPIEHGYDDLIKLLDQARQSGTTAQGEIDWPDKRTWSVLITPIEDGGQVAVLHDVTHFKDLDRVKSEFIATASHDLKNPIASILGYSDLLEKAGVLNTQQTDFVHRIQKAAEQMHELVLNLLELARMDMGTEIKLEPCDLSDLLLSVTDEFQPQAELKQQTLTLVPLEGRPRVQGDVLRLRQVMRNLVGNAIKYTPRTGQVTVSAEAREQTVQVKIQDTGIGIPPADLPFVFDKFYRVQMDATEGIEGNGLGLAIVKSILEKHGGQVAVESMIGQGTCFSFTLPLVQTQGELPPNSPVEYNVVETGNALQ